MINNLSISVPLSVYMDSRARSVGGQAMEKDTAGEKPRAITGAAAPGKGAEDNSLQRHADTLVGPSDIGVLAKAVDKVKVTPKDGGVKGAGRPGRSRKLP